jgi:hypothetical protein
MQSTQGSYWLNTEQINHVLNI